MIENAQAQAEQKREYSNFAFISYCHDDEKFAKRLQHKIEAYNLPSRIRKEYKNLPNRMSPVFRDKTDLAGVFLKESIQKQLEDSRFLVVVCSPNATKSPWVKFEVEYFCSLGRKDRIIPISIAGTPNASKPGEEECLPDAIKAITPELLCINSVEFGTRKAFLHVIATMLELRPDDLIQRDKFRRNTRTAIVGAIMLLLLSAIFAYIWQSSEHTAYYSGYITKYEIPYGVNKLSASQRANRDVSYRIVTKNGLVVRLEMVNSKGIPTNPTITNPQTDYPIKQFRYNDQKELNTIISADKYGKTMLVQKVTIGENEITLDYHSSEKSNLSSSMTSGSDYYEQMSSDETEQKSEVIRRVNTYDENGFQIKSLFYRDTMGTPARDEDGVYGAMYTYDNNGYIQSTTYLDKDGNIVNNRYGVAKALFTYNADGYITEVKTQDANGTPSRGDNGYYKSEATYDTYGNVETLKFFSEEDNACNDKYGVHMYKYIYNGSLMEKTEFLDVNGNPTANINGIASYKYEHDKQGRLSVAYYLDINGNPVCDKKTKYSSIAYKYDNNNRVIEQKFFDVNGNPCCNASTGVYIERGEYDEDGNITAFSYCDASGNPMCSNTGYASARYTIDSNGRIEKIEYYDENGNPCPSIDNFATSEYEYDPYGNCITVAFYDKENNPCFSNSAVHKMKRTYENGNMTTETYFDTDDKPALINSDNIFYHCVEKEYDESGNCISYSYLDKNLQPIDISDGYSTIKYSYDSYGNVVKYEYLDSNGNAPSNYYSAIKAYYDKQGNIISEEYESSFKALSYYRVDTKYNDHDEPTEYTYYDKDGNTLESDTQYYLRKITYNNTRNITQTESFYSSGKVESYIYEYDSFGNNTLRKYYVKSPSGDNVCQWQLECEFDQFGNITKQNNLDGNGIPVNSVNGYSTIVRTYSPRGFEASREYYDKDGLPVLCENGYFRIVNEYDHAGNATRTEYYDTNCNPVTPDSGLPAYSVSEYDHRGNIVYYARYDENNQLISTEGEACIIRYEYDNLGYLIKTTYYDETDEIVYEQVPYIVVKEVYDYCPYDVQAGDMVVAYGDWCVFDEDVHILDGSIAREMAQLRDKEKTIILFGKRDGINTFIEIHADAGIMGIGFVDNSITCEMFETIGQLFKSRQAAE